ncbi:uncharacterized protein LOC129737635 [Uranotaenia lowii]|uniref:uncharacterized protein LOC129737635 n=1 Tax=Uranotaenia lowii TaxID=190385 RepID=UPI00247AA903|nr:uncharacterized protein LOC129737635 [Uranotaenia lowii]
MLRACTRGHCRQCQHKHHTLLHPVKVNSAPIPNNPHQQQQPHAQDTTTPTNQRSAQSSSYPVSLLSNPPHTTDPLFNTHALPINTYTSIHQVLLSTALARVTDQHGNSLLARALLDSCSEYWFMTTNLYKKLELVEASSFLSVAGIGGSVARSNKRVHATILPGLDADGPTLQQTVFGWVISGRVPNSHQVVPKSVAHPCSNVELRETLTRFWELESCISKSLLSVEESACEEFYNETTFRDDDQRYVVSLPKKGYLIEKLGDSRATALRRLEGLERRFVRDSALKQQYCAFIREYIDMGHMIEVSEEPNQLAYYMPHHPVQKPDSTTTKLRVVFDASCRTSTGISLNDALMVGPVVQDDLLTTVTYGTATAPYPAAAAAAAAVIKKDVYVDDLMTGTDDPEERVQLVSAINILTNSAGFVLRKYCSNSPEVLSNIPSELRDERTTLEVD